MRIEMNNPAGIRLRTKDKELDEDIEVVPTFDIAETVDIELINNGRNYSIRYTTVENGAVISKEANYDYTDPISSLNNVVVGTVLAIIIPDSYNTTATIEGLELLGQSDDGTTGIVAILVTNEENLSIAIDI